MKSNFIKKNQVAILTIVLVCFLSGLGLFYFNKQKQERKRQEEEEYYAQLLLKYTRILFYPPLAPEPEPAPEPEIEKIEAKPEKVEEVHAAPIKKPEVKPDVYQRIESLLASKKTSPGYVKGLAMLFQFSMEVCDNLNGQEKNFSIEFFTRQTELLLANYNTPSKSDINPAAFSAEENSLRQEVCRITDEKTIQVFQKFFTEAKDEKMKAALVQYLAAYLMVTRASSQIAAEIPVFLKAVPSETLLTAFFQLVAEKGGEQDYLYFSQDMVNYCKEKDCVIWALKNVGDLYRREKRTAEAIEVYRIIVQRYHGAEESLTAQEKIIEIYSQDWHLYSNAINECIQLIKLFPESESAVKARFMVGQLYYQLNDYPRALASFQQFLRYYPKGKQVPDAYLFSALCYISRQENDKAVKQLQYVVSRYKDHELAPRAQFLIGYCYLSRQKYYEARREYQRLVDLFPTSRYAERAKNFVEKLGKVKKR